MSPGMEPIGPERQPGPRPSIETSRSGGGAYTPPPPPPPREPPRGGSGGSRRPWLAIVATLVVALGALGVWASMPKPDASTASALVVATQQERRVLRLSSADIDWQATLLAQQMIRSGRTASAAAPGAVAPGTATASVSASASASATAPAPAAPAVTPSTVATPPATPLPTTQAPVVHRPRTRPRPASIQAAQADPSPPSAELQQAVAAVVERATPEERQAIVEGRQVLYSLHVLDNLAEDGDQVEVFFNGASRGIITLTNTGQDLELTLPAGSTLDVKVVATADGGGGVTFGASASQGEVKLGPMDVGKSLEWSLTLQ